RMEQFCLDRCAGWLACGRTVEQTLLPRGYDRRPHRVIPLGVDGDTFRPDAAKRERMRRGLGLEDTRAVVGFLGRFLPEKGLDLLTRVLDQVAVPWRALFVGGGPLEFFLRSWSERYPGRASIHTSVPHEKVADYLNAMDVLCAP